MKKLMTKQPLTAVFPNKKSATPPKAKAMPAAPKATMSGKKPGCNY